MALRAERTVSTRRSSSSPRQVPRSALGHTTWSRQTIEAGNTVFLETLRCINHYHATLIRGVHRGEPLERMARATEAVASALEETIVFMRPDVTAHDAHEVCRRVIAEADRWASAGVSGTSDHEFP